MHGKSASDMAEKLNVSVRTIEMHLNLVKEKIGCRKKSDIIDAIINLYEQSHNYSYKHSIESY